MTFAKPIADEDRCEAMCQPNALEDIHRCPYQWRVVINGWKLCRIHELKTQRERAA